MKCAFCKFGPDDTETEAEFIVNGQGVCEKHVDNAEGIFGRALNQLWDESQR